MKIIHLILGKANPERMNGVNKVVHHLSIAQFQLGYPVEIWGMSNSKESDVVDRPLPTKVFEQPKYPFFLDKKLLQQLRAIQENVIFHIHGAFIPSFARISQLLKRLDIPYIFTPHGSYTEGAFQNGFLKKYIYFHLFEKSLLSHAKAIQILGKNEWDYLQKRCSLSNKTLIPNGQTVFPYTTPEKTLKSKPIFGFCGRLAIHHKGLDLLLEAFKIYKKQGGTGQLELIGDGADRKDLETMVPHLIQNKNITFHGKQFGQKKIDLLKQMDVFVHTSRNEGFPMAVLEAAALGIPCLTSEETNVNDHIRAFDAGYPYTNNQVEIIVQKLHEAENDFFSKQLTTKGYHAWQMVRQKFSWKKIAQDLQAVYTR